MNKKDILLNANGDVDMSTGDLQFTTGLQALEQSIRIRLQFYANEWFLDPTAGLPYYRDVLKKNPDPATLKAVFRAALLETPGVTNVDALDLSLDSVTRRLTVTFRVSGDLGVLDASVTV